MQVPNEALMRADIDNLSESGTRLEHVHFAVDAAGVTPDMIADLSHRVHAATTSKAQGHLFDRSYHPHASITAVADPLKFHVRCHRNRKQGDIAACAAAGPCMLCAAVSVVRLVDTQEAPMRRMQVALLYRLACSEELFERCEDARTQVSFVIAEWQRAHNLGHTQSLQPYIMAPSGDSANSVCQGVPR